MKRRWLAGISFLALFTLAALLLAGCGVAQKDYDAAVARADALAADKTGLETQVASLTADNTALTSEKTELQSQVDSLQSDKSGLQADKTNLQADKDKLTADLNSLQDQYDAAAADLNAVNEVYPPRQFATVQEFKVWLAGNPVSEMLPSLYADEWYLNALTLQADALKDGFIVSVDYDVFDDGTYDVWCTTVIDGTIYYWDPETDNYYADTNLVVGASNTTL